MSEPNVFIIYEGMIQVQYAYWSNDKKAILPDETAGVLVFGDVADNNPLYFHIRIQDLFILNNKKWGIQKNASIHIDLLSIHHSMYHELQVKEDFDNLASYVNLLHSFKLNLTTDKTIAIGEGEKINGYELGATVVGLSDSPAPAYLTKVPGRNATTALNAFDYDLCFEFKPDDATRKKLFTEKALRKYVFAWVWVEHGKSREEYKTAFNIDITSAENRIDFLKKPDKNFFGAIDVLLSPISKNKRHTRSMLYMHKYNDGFPYDEQTMNYIEMSRCLPFKSLTVGAQPGPVGISTMPAYYFDRYLKHHRSYSSIFLVDGKPSLHLKLDTDQDFKPDFVQDCGVTIHGLASNLNEFYSRADNRFFFKEKSVSHWVNSLEKQFPSTGSENGMSAISTKETKYAFSDGKLEIVTHDFIKYYKAENPSLNRYPGSERFIEQKTIDLSSFESIHVAPAAEIKTDDGRLFAKVGKGFPGQEKFTETMHSKVFFSGSDDTWQGHAICQRPLIITYELDRDLTVDELKLLDTNPVQLLFWYGTSDTKKSVEHPLKIDYEKGSKKGMHAILVYLLTNVLQLEVSVDEGAIVQTDNIILRNGGHARAFDCSCALPESFMYYLPENSGLFTGNPIISVDDFQEDETRNAKLTKLKADYRKALVNKNVTFLLGFLPAKDLLQTGWEVIGEIAEKGKASAESWKKLCEEGVKVFFKDMLKKQDVNNTIAQDNDVGRKAGKAGHEHVNDIVTNSTKNVKSTATKFLKFAQEIQELTSTYIDSTSLISSPLLKGIAFSEGLSTDSLYSIAVTAKTIKIDRSTITAVTTEKKESFEIFKNREIVNKGKAPCNYQFGSTGGLLARDKAKYDQIDSVSCYRIDFQNRINDLREDLGRDSQATVGGYMRRLSSGQKFMDLLNKHSINTALSTFAKEKDIGKLFSTALSNPADLSEEQRVIVTAFLNLLLYIDSSFIYCPACGNLVSLSWGWCPYHATKEILAKNGVVDSNNDGNMKREFSKYVEDRLKNPHLLDLLNSKNKESCLLVHWTDFVVS